MSRRKWVASITKLLILFTGTTIPSNAQMRDTFKSASGMTKSQIAAIENSLVSAYQKAMLSAKTTATATKISVTTKSSTDTVTKCLAGGYIHTTISSKVYATISASPSISIDGSGLKSFPVGVVSAIGLSTAILTSVV
jgi:hypothetical protein